MNTPQQSTNRSTRRISFVPAVFAALSLSLLIACSGCKEEEPAPPTAEQLEQERQEHKSHAQREMEDMRN